MFLSPSRIAAIFPDITVPQLCALSTPPITPSDVHEIVPSVTVNQLAAFFDLVQELIPKQEDGLPPAKVPKIAVKADEEAETPVPGSSDLTETLFQRLKQLASTRYEFARQKHIFLRYVINVSFSANTKFRYDSKPH